MDMYDFCSYYCAFSDIDRLSSASATIKKLFGDDDNSVSDLTALRVYMIFQLVDNGETQTNITKDEFYDMMIICLDNSKDNIRADRVELFATIKNGLFKYLGLTSAEFDVFMKEVVIENANCAENIDVEELLNDLTNQKKYQIKT